MPTWRRPPGRGCGRPEPARLDGPDPGGRDRRLASRWRATGAGSVSGGSLTTSRPPTRRNGAAHSATTAGGPKDCGPRARSKLPRSAPGQPPRPGPPRRRPDPPAQPGDGRLEEGDPLHAAVEQAPSGPGQARPGSVRGRRHRRRGRGRAWAPRHGPGERQGVLDVGLEPGPRKPRSLGLARGSPTGSAAAIRGGPTPDAISRRGR